ncbi:hypothetical protein AOZ06_50600 [Kibdelosporangium phytohabitans]|uniref:DUF4349 domain-containing protein n=1 Tax=Kibdelosporangium phytohabitans TaxID=860235 RepID=A0A0N9IFH9_9PSEU|nr:DUF4349 domain-containing protein [Kibdelosporangium phytohabitans]ALG14038.1 hypothetical protein AOZ06_50600 [Kibdelosporangium phytohabitans]
MALLLGLTACSGESGGGFASSPEGVAKPAQPNSAKGQTGGGSGGGSAREQQTPTQAGQPPAPVQERKLVQTARIDMTVKDTFKAVSDARSIATTNQGFTGQEESSGDRASITLRVPADKFDSALRQLAEIGTIRTQHKQADDVTEQVVDLESRLNTQRQSVARMQALLARATSVGEIAQIEGELTRRQADLESLQGRRDALGGKVALSTVTVSVSREAAPPVPVQAAGGGGFFDGLTDGWDAFGAFFTGLARVLGAVLPFLLALGIPAGLVLYFRRRRRKPVGPVAESA